MGYVVLKESLVITGEEIISGSQRIHTQKLLCAQIKKSGIDADSLKGFIESFK